MAKEWVMVKSCRMCGLLLTCFHQSFPGTFHQVWIAFQISGALICELIDPPGDPLEPVIVVVG